MPGSRRRALILTAALVVSGCGSGAGHRGASTVSPDAALYRRLARCIREHGMPDFPDPVRDPATGRWRLAPGASRPPAAVLQACKSITDRLPHPAKAPPPSAADMDGLRRFARCVRDHGVPDWPDPNPDGAFPLPQRLLRSGANSVHQQIAACKQHIPGHTIRIAPPGG